MYRTKYNRFKRAEFKKELGRNHDLYDEFMTFLHWMVGVLDEAYTMNWDREAQVHLPWPSNWQIEEMKTESLEWVLPPEEFLELADYLKTNPEPPADRIVMGPGGVKLVKHVLR